MRGPVFLYAGGGAWYTGRGGLPPKIRQKGRIYMKKTMERGWRVRA